jgi:peptidoglycan/LPS O-acetylase OafA/YrhL
VIAAWWIASLGLMLVQVDSSQDSTCLYASGPRFAQLIVGWSGCAFWLRAVTADDDPQRWRIASVVLLGLWLAIVFAWMPSVPHECQGR